jgi:hypothetical protein
MTAAKACDLHGLLEGHIIENADATQAYAQSLLGGAETWVSLPREEWPESWRHVRRPVCPLEKALYGHLDAGGYWEQHCDNHLRDCGFLPIAGEDKAWRSCYWSPSLSCYMIVYVDDSKISGPADNVKKAWELIRAENARTGKPGIVLDNPTPAGKFLGCSHVCSEDWGPPMSKDRTPMTKLPTEEERNNYHTGAQKAAQTTKPDAMICATSDQGGMMTTRPMRVRRQLRKQQSLTR